MEQMTLCIDISKCTACRACQVACKNWNQLKAEQTENRGGHENPPDLSARTWNRILFQEIRRADGVIDWSFISDRCRHCDEPPCMEAGESEPGAIIQHESGAVIFTEKTTELDYDEVLSACPYDIPRKDEDTGRIYKCTLCIDRITHGLLPACVCACSTGALRFGPRTQILYFIEERIKAIGGDAEMYPGPEHNTIWILPESSSKYPLAQAAPQGVVGRVRLARTHLSGPLYAGVLLTAGLFRLRDRVRRNEQQERDNNM